MSTPAVRELTPTIVDRLAREQPDKIYLSVAKDARGVEYEDINFRSFARAVNRCAWWIQDRIGDTKDVRPIFAMLPPQDIRHGVLVLAAVKTGNVMFFSSPVNTLASHLGLLERLRCETFFTSSHNEQMQSEILVQRAMYSAELPLRSLWFSSEGEVTNFPYSKTWDEGIADPLVILHSSGTTGIPKILICAHGTYSCIEAYKRVPEIPCWTCDQWTNKRVFTSMPWYHSSGFIFLLNLALHYDVVPVIIPDCKSTRMDAISAANALTYGKVEAAYMTPSLLVDLAKEIKYLHLFSELRTLSFAGSSVPADVGDLISKFVRITPIFGSTECGYLPTRLPPAQLWSHYNFHSILGHEFRHFANDMYELVITRKPELTDALGVFYTFPELSEYSMKDLYVENIEHRGWWRSVGRTDDVLVFTDARKLNPIAMEARIEEHPAVRFALVCGHARERPVLLIEPTEPRSMSIAQKTAFIEGIWPQIERAMSSAPNSGALTKDAVIVTRPEDPMLRVGTKALIRRRPTWDLYSDEIDRTYQNLGAVIYGS